MGLRRFIGYHSGTEMKMNLQRELYWLLGGVGLTGMIGLWIFGGKILDGIPVDIQLHDTYYVFTKSHVLTVILLLLLTTTYLTRVIYYKLNNKIVNGILTFLLLIALVVQLINLNWVIGLEAHARILYSREMDEEVQMKVIAGFKIIKGIVWALLIITGTLLTTAVYKTFKSITVE